MWTWLVDLGVEPAPSPTTPVSTVISLSVMKGGKKPPEETFHVPMRHEAAHVKRGDV